MFNHKDDSETDFCESYKSQVLGKEEEKEDQSLFSTLIKLLTILVLLLAIIGISFYGYHYFMNNTELKNSILPPVSTQIAEKEIIDDDDLVVTLEEPVNEKKIEEKELKTLKIEEKKIEIEVPKTLTEEIDIDKIANEIKIEIAKSEIKEENSKVKSLQKEKKISEVNDTITAIDEINISKSEKSLEVPTTSAPEAQYLEELAKLSREIDKERKK